MPAQQARDPSHEPRASHTQPHLQHEVGAAAAVLAYHRRRAGGALTKRLPRHAGLPKAAQLAADHVRRLA